MSEPATSAVLTNIAVTSVTGAGIIIFGVNTGLDYPTVIAGFAGGATALSYLEPGKPFKRAIEVITATLLAGYSSPAISGLLIPLLAAFQLIDAQTPTPHGLQYGAAFLIAYLAHSVVLPGLKKMGKSFVRRYSQ